MLKTKGGQDLKGNQRRWGAGTRESGPGYSEAAMCAKLMGIQLLPPTPSFKITTVGTNDAAKFHSMQPPRRIFSLIELLFLKHRGSMAYGPEVVR